MTQDEIKALAKQAGGTPYVNRHFPDKLAVAFSGQALFDFVALVRERVPETDFGNMAQEHKPLHAGWKATRIDGFEIRVVSPEGEAWRLRSADANDIFNNFIFRWAEAMLDAKEQP